MFLPVPSLDNKYEISTGGKLRNVKTGYILKPIKGYKGNLRYNCTLNGKNVRCYVSQLLFEVHGIEPPKKFPAAIGVTVVKDGCRKYFKSCRAAAKFLSPKIFYTLGDIRKKLRLRFAEICGWQIFYHDHTQRN